MSITFNFDTIPKANKRRITSRQALFLRFFNTSPEIIIVQAVLASAELDGHPAGLLSMIAGLTAGYHIQQCQRVPVGCQCLPDCPNSKCRRQSTPFNSGAAAPYQSSPQATPFSRARARVC